MMCKISVITPIFNGKKYIKDLILQIEKCQRKIGESWTLEFLLINDNPNDSLCETAYRSDSIDVRIFNTNKNRGTHRARVQGLSHANGEYIVFLDQDDILYPDYINSQLSCIGDADAAVCRCIHENQQFYNADRKFEEVISKDYMMQKGNPIISAGQVLIRRASIPKVWTENIMRTNCADDYLLWLCMTAQGAKFVLNQDILFEHVVHGNNLSLDSRRELSSLEEMCEILCKNSVFDEHGMKQIKSMCQHVLCERIGLLEKFREMFFVLNKMAVCRESGNVAGKHLWSEGIHRVCIYGDGYIGKRLAGELKECKIETAFFIDRNAQYLTEEIPVYQLEEAPIEVDAVIISLVQHYDSVRNELRKKYKTQIYTVQEVLEDV